MTLHLEIVTPERLVYSDDVDRVQVPGSDGELGILPHHAPLLGALAPGWIVRIDRVDEPQLNVAVHGGFLSVRDDGVSVLAEMAETADEIDAARARQAYADADPNTPDGAAARERALARLRAVGESV